MELDSNKRKENEDVAEHHTVAVQQHDGQALKGSGEKYVKHLGFQKILVTGRDFSLFFPSVIHKMRLLNLVVMRACLALRTVKLAR